MIRHFIFVVANLFQIPNELKYIKIEFNLKLKYLKNKNPKTQRDSKILLVKFQKFQRFSIF